MSFQQRKKKRLNLDRQQYEITSFNISMLKYTFSCNFHIISNVLDFVQLVNNTFLIENKFLFDFVETKKNV